MKIFAGAVPDQYYVVTSRLAARGYQQTAMRVIAGCILMAGLPAALAAPNPRASHWPLGSAAFLAMALLCVAMAIPWLRYRWPSREVSTAVITVGSIALGTGCSLSSSPLAGLLIAVAFPFILGYAALFHGNRVQTFTAAVSAMTILGLLLRIAAIDVPTAVAVGTPIVMLNIVITVGCRIIAGLTAGSPDARTDVEPLTGLLTREGFDELTATMLGARNRDEDRYLVVVLLAIDSFGQLQSLQGSRTTDRARIAVAQALRETVRRDALIGHISEAEFVVADTFTTPDPAPLAERLRGAVAATPHGITASIGAVCTPLRPLADRLPYKVLDDIIALATTAMYQARRRGGNQADYVIDRGNL